ncbi:short-chain dehydrogenase/reductase SDR [Rhizoclosmatium globosum]|uniref:Short-chain dehydrogenase/reductase SDR n=1 Tax=Rhizoclosmatium globosum TaxID=329046 RepID=A0A1Y2CL69_9FUNG|nr:short-chain dehydrogenase/reductase SDR [Rhizoclosmatium globosum]|eukprot:ORY47075.1 short-chain dehydrogenase/reductase SDR [Rhizoclosmatium globosum]
MSFLKTCVVAGTGPGNGAAIARAFSKEGFHVALLSRSNTFTSSLASELGNATAITCDLSDEISIAQAAKKIESECPPVEVLVFNAGGASTFRPGTLLDIQPSELIKSISARSMGPLALSQHLLPGMVERKKGSVLFTGATASLRGSANFAFVAIPSFSCKALAESMAREFMPKGIHVSHIVLDGAVESERARQWMPNAGPDDLIQPKDVAANYVMLHNQPRSTWTFELVLRPAVEKW